MVSYLSGIHGNVSYILSTKRPNPSNHNSCSEYAVNIPLFVQCGKKPPTQQSTKGRDLLVLNASNSRKKEKGETYAMIYLLHTFLLLTSLGPELEHLSHSLETGFNVKLKNYPQILMRVEELLESDWITVWQHSAVS